MLFVAIFLNFSNSITESENDYHYCHNNLPGYAYFC